MKNVIKFFILLFLLGCSSNEESISDFKKKLDSLIDNDNSKIEILKLIMEQEGDYEIYFRDGVRADTYLLDKKNGRVWREYQDTKSEMMFWKESDVIN